MTDRKTEMLEKVRKLLAKANDASVGEQESEAFRQKADEFMTAYAIEAWEIEMAKEGTRAKPIKRVFDYSWFTDTHDSPLRNALWNIWYDTARHCRVVQVSSKRDYGAKEIPVIGMEADLDYFDMLFTSLMLQLSMKSDPKPSERLTLEENLAAMREAGFGWDKITRRLIEAGLVDDPNPGMPFPAKRADWKIMTRERFLLSERLVKRYRDWCAATDRPQTYTNVKTYREHFAAGFSSKIGERLVKMRRESERVYDAGHTGNSAALAVRDIRVVVQEAVWDFFPDLKPPPPHPVDCDCDACHRRKCTDPKCKRPRCVESRKPIKYRAPKQPKIDYAARAAGEQAAREANLHGNPQRGLRKTPEIER
jgi:hypothetical protein